MKPQLLIVTDIFKLSNSRYKSIIRLCIWEKILAQVTEVHISKDGCTIKGLKKELTNTVTIACASAGSCISSTIHVNCKFHAKDFI